MAVSLLSAVHCLLPDLVLLDDDPLSWPPPPKKKKEQHSQNQPQVDSKTSVESAVSLPFKHLDA